jgi:anti-sigma factor RsiW
MLVRTADGESDAVGEQSALHEHLERCASCRAALAEQRAVAAVLRSRPHNEVSPDFAHRLSRRLDDASGWFGIADWRVWTCRLAPVAAGLALVALVTPGQTATEASVTLDEWARATADSTSAASLLWQRDVTPESLLETIVTGRPPATGNSANVR